MSDLSGVYDCPMGFGPVTVENRRETISRWPQTVYDVVWRERGRRHSATVLGVDIERHIEQGRIVRQQNQEQAS